MDNLWGILGLVLYIALGVLIVRKRKPILNFFIIKKLQLQNILFNNSILRIPQSKWDICLVGVLLVNVLALIFYKYYFKRCPSCQSDWRHPVIQSDLLDRQSFNTTVTNNVVTQHKSRDGQLVGTSETPVTRAAVKIVEKHLNTYQCISCAHQFQLQETSSSIH